MFWELLTPNRNAEPSKRPGFAEVIAMMTKLKLEMFSDRGTIDPSFSIAKAPDEDGEYNNQPPDISEYNS